MRKKGFEPSALERGGSRKDPGKIPGMHSEVAFVQLRDLGYNNHPHAPPARPVPSPLDFCLHPQLCCNNPLLFSRPPARPTSHSRSLACSLEIQQPRAVDEKTDTPRGFPPARLVVRGRHGFVRPVRAAVRAAAPSDGSLAGARHVVVLRNQLIYTFGGDGRGEGGVARVRPPQLMFLLLVVVWFIFILDRDGQP